MAKKWLFIIDPLDSLNITTDTTLALIEESNSRGIDTYVCQIEDIFLDHDLAHFLAAPVQVKKNYQQVPKSLEDKKALAADFFDAIFMRKDPPVDERFIAALLMLRCHNKDRTKIFNDPDSMLLANEKLFGLQIAHKYFPKTLVSSNKGIIEDFVKSRQKVVIKPLFGMGGSGVMVFEHNDNNLHSALELVSQGYRSPVMVQDYLKHARLGDKRIIVLGGMPVGAVLRVPQAHEHRANVHAGGSASGSDISKRELEIISSLSPHLVKLGLHFVGIDVIDGYLTEINVTSPTCVLEIEKYSQKKHDRPLRAQIVDYFLEVLA